MKPSELEYLARHDSYQFGGEIPERYKCKKCGEIVRDTGFSKLMYPPIYILACDGCKIKYDETSDPRSLM